MRTICNQNAVGLKYIDDPIIAGRTIAVIQDGFVPQGRHTAVWDGRDSSGKNVASGIYLYNITAGNHTGFGKMTLIR